MIRNALCQIVWTSMRLFHGAKRGFEAADLEKYR